MSIGNLVKLLLKTRVARYLEWKPVDGTFVYQVKEGGLFSKGGPRIEKVNSLYSSAFLSFIIRFPELVKKL